MSYDLAILGDPEDTVPDLTINNTANDGVYKLVQRVMILLLTDVNAENNPGGVGTNIPDIIRGGNVPSPEVVSNIFSAGLVEIKEALIADVTPDTPADEIPNDLKPFVVTDEGNAPDRIQVDIEVSTQAGSSVRVSIPISNITTGE
jgi:hypothetical protein